MVEIGKSYKTVGGWIALVIYISSRNGIFYAIHASNSPQESIPIIHKMDGECMSAFSIGEPPRFGRLHPADILVNEVIQ